MAVSQLDSGLRMPRRISAAPTNIPPVAERFHREATQRQPGEDRVTGEASLRAAPEVTRITGPVGPAAPYRLPTGPGSSCDPRARTTGTRCPLAVTAVTATTRGPAKERSTSTSPKRHCSRAAPDSPISPADTNPVTRSAQWVTAVGDVGGVADRRCRVVCRERRGCGTQARGLPRWRGQGGGFAVAPMRPFGPSLPEPPAAAKLRPGYTGSPAAGALGALSQTAPGSAVVRPLTAAPELDGWAITERRLKDLMRLGDQVWLVVDDVRELGPAEAGCHLEPLVMRGPVIDQHVDDLAEVKRDGPILGRQIVPSGGWQTPGGSSLPPGPWRSCSAAQVTRTNRHSAWRIGFAQNG